MIGAPQRESVEEHGDEHDEVGDDNAYVCMYRQRGSDAGFVHHDINQRHNDICRKYGEDKVIIKFTK